MKYLFSLLVKIWSFSVILLGFYWVFINPENNNIEYSTVNITLIFCILVGLLSIFINKYKSDLAIYLKITIFSVVISFYLFQGFSLLKSETDRFLYPSIHDRIVALKKNGLDAHASIPVLNLVDMFSNDTLPLGGIPDSLTVLCHENGETSVYQSDAHGFNNPKDVWDQIPTYAFIGDSYTHGYCLENSLTFVGKFREKYPNTLNLAWKGNGPLIQLAGVREYLPSVKPRLVFWAVFIGNDSLNLEEELRIPLLKRYLTKDYSQNLINRSKEIKTNLLAFEKIYTSRGLTNRKPFDLFEDLKDLSMRQWLASMARFITFRKISSILHGKLSYDAPLIERAPQLNKILHRSIISKVKQETDQWGGKLVLVIIADKHTCKIGQNDPNYIFVKNAAKSIGLDFIDTVPANCKGSRPNAFFSREYTHFNVEGHNWLGDRLIRFVERLGLP